MSNTSEAEPLHVTLAMWGVPVVAFCIWLGVELRQPLSRSDWVVVAFWTVLGILAHAGEFELPRKGSLRVFMSAGFAVSAAAVADLPPAGAMIAVAFGSMTLKQFRKSPRPFLGMALNRGILGLCALTGAAVFHPVYDALPSWELLRLVAASGLASFVYFSTNVALVGAILALRSGRPLARPWMWPLVASPNLLWNYLALGLLGDLILTMLRVGQAVGLILALIPLAVSYFSMRQTADLSRHYDALVSTLVDSLDMRDHETGGHTRRVAALTVRLGSKLGMRGQELNDLRTAALLHDLGKIGIADAILLKPSGLTDEEWQQMRQHPELGARLLAAHPLLRGAVPLIRHHHERYDGRGYPDGLYGQTIPLGARIITAVDAFMAMVDGRPYRAAIPPEAALTELRRMAGAQFDPRIIASLQPADWESVLTDDPTAVETPVVRT